MRRFTFRYESLLKVNRLRAEEAERELGEALGSLWEAEHALELLRRQKREYLDALLCKKREGAISEIQFLEGALQTINAQLEVRALRVTQAELNVEEHRERLVEALKKAKTVELLRARDLDVYTQESAREEGRVLDEVGTSLHIRKDPS